MFFALTKILVKKDNIHWTLTVAWLIALQYFKKASNLYVKRGENLSREGILLACQEFTFLFKEEPTSATNRKSREKTVKKCLDLLILSLAKKEPISGYDIILFTRNNFDVWLSSGTVYSSLLALVKSGLLTRVDKHRVARFKLSSKGEENLLVAYLTFKKISSLLELATKRT
jgi:DNA-binding PadR family transcriptional regulator